MSSALSSFSQCPQTLQEKKNSHRRTWALVISPRYKCNSIIILVQSLQQRLSMYILTQKNTSESISCSVSSLVCCCPIQRTSIMLNESQFLKHTLHFKSLVFSQNTFPFTWEMTGYLLRSSNYVNLCRVAGLISRLLIKTVDRVRIWLKLLWCIQSHCFEVVYFPISPVLFENLDYIQLDIVETWPSP